MDLLRKGMATGINFSNDCYEQCDASLKGKHSQFLFKSKGAKRESDVLQLVHSDVCDPRPQESWGGAI